MTRVDAGVGPAGAEPLVEAAAGGRQGGGARLTARGATVLAAFRRLERAAARAAAREIAAMREAA